MGVDGGADASGRSEEKMSAQAQRVAELEQRIRVLSELGDAELGEFTRLDWVLLLGLGAVVPLIVLYWGAP
ncbi:MAG: hypothetical protein OSB70_01470 [Myxococcota bacterium]|nr:hypothetical protein [Myxococcota bacterium]